MLQVSRELSGAVRQWLRHIEYIPRAVHRTVLAENPVGCIGRFPLQDEGSVLPDKVAVVRQ